MSGFSMIPYKLWDEAFFRRLPDDAKLTLLNLWGRTRVFPACVARASSVAETLGWEPSRVHSALGALEPVGVDHDRETGVTFLPCALAETPPRGPKQAAGARRGFNELPDCPTRRRAFVAVAATLSETDRPHFVDPAPPWFGLPIPAPDHTSDTVSIGYPESAAYRTVPYRTVPKTKRTVPSGTDASADGTDVDELLGYLTRQLGDRARDVNHLERFVAIARTAPNPREVIDLAVEQFVPNATARGGVLQDLFKRLAAEQREAARQREARRAEKAAEPPPPPPPPRVDPKTLPKAELRPPPPHYRSPPRQTPNDWEAKGEPEELGAVMPRVAKAGGAS